jgi:hypothetical protein
MKSLILTIPISLRASTTIMALPSGVSGRMPAETNAIREEKIARNVFPYQEPTEITPSQMMRCSKLTSNGTMDRRPIHTVASSVRAKELNWPPHVQTQKHFNRMRSPSQRVTLRCPLWVKSRHHNRSAECPLYPRKQTSVGGIRTSALGHPPSLLVRDHSGRERIRRLVATGGKPADQINRSSVFLDALKVSL